VTVSLARLIPIVAWLPRYQRRWLRGDLAATGLGGDHAAQRVAAQADWDVRGGSQRVA
jgi:hypothetical protein